LDEKDVGEIAVSVWWHPPRVPCFLAAAASFGVSVKGFVLPAPQ